MSLDLETQCKSCQRPTWIGDRHCRNCGTQIPGAADVSRRSGLHMVDLEDEQSVPRRRGGPTSRRNALVLFLGVLGLIFAFSLIRGADDQDDQAGSEQAGTDGDEEPIPSIYLPDNPPERQAALDAFQAGRDRAWTLDSVFDRFGIDEDVIVHEEMSSLRLRRDARGEMVVDLSDDDPAEFGPLGAVTNAPYRIGRDNPITIDRYDSEIERWRLVSWSSPPEQNSLAPINSIAASDSHVATEAGGLVRLWRRSDGRETAAIPGRLQASTGDLFFIGGNAYTSDAVKQPAPIAGMLTAQARIRVWDDLNNDGQVQETEMSVPDRSGTEPIRSVVAPDFTAVIDPSGWLATRSVIDTTLPYNGAFVDIAPIANGTALLALSVDSLLVIRFDGSPIIDVPVDIQSARGLSLVAPNS